MEPAYQSSKFISMTKFDLVDRDGEIETPKFIQACFEFVCILDDLGSAFKMAKKDMGGNIKKINERYLSNPGKYTTLNSMLEEDSSSGKKKSSTIVSVLWLRRGLDFVRAILVIVCKSYHENVENDDMKSLVLSAYEVSLKPFHGKILQFAFSKMLRFVPSRSSFLRSLAGDKDTPLDKVVSDMELYVQNLTANVNLIENLLNKCAVNSSDEA